MAIDTKRVTRRKFVGMLGALGTGVGVSACGQSVRRETERNAYAAEAASPAVASPIVSSHATHTTSATGSSGEPGVCAFHCHILSHAESVHGMFGMVTALIVEEYWRAVGRGGAGSGIRQASCFAHRANVLPSREGQDRRNRRASFAVAS